jgi:H+/Cl- antiporter ClcA
VNAISENNDNKFQHLIGQFLAENMPSYKRDDEIKYGFSVFIIINLDFVEAIALITFNADFFAMCKVEICQGLERDLWFWYLALLLLWGFLKFLKTYMKIFSQILGSNPNEIKNLLHFQFVLIFLLKIWPEKTIENFLKLQFITTLNELLTLVIMKI